MTSPFLLASVFECLRTHLPSYAEEGTLRESIPESDLIATLRKAGIGEDASVLLVTMLTRQFDSLALLDRSELAQDRWTFVSFPASLFARSLVETWLSGHAIVPIDYWEQGDHRPPAVKEEQRALLHRIESERRRQNPDARPVRTVHVAWALIRLGDGFLLHRREDRDRPGEKTHVLPGGRFNPSDLPSTALTKGPAVLREVFEPASPLVDSCLDTTLVRELEEELGLLPGEDYSFDRWQRLPAYRDLAGTGNRHAYTEYAFQLYTIKLTPVGEVHLLDREAKSATLAWFSINDLAVPCRTDGTSAYIDVLHAAWGEEIADRLTAIPESAALPLAMIGETRMLDLPAKPDSPWKLGKPGKEKSLSFMLDAHEWHLLLLMGWHVHRFAIENPKKIHLLGGGWIRFDDDSAIHLGRSLLNKSQQELQLVEMRDGHYVRLSIDPNILMFSPGLFTYAIEGDDQEGGLLRISRNSLSTPWAVLAGETVSFEINRNTLRILRALERGEDPLAKTNLLAGDWERNLRQQLSPELRRIGLRKLWATENKSSSLVGILRVTI
jgi:8-oxo-dGTP pyrophosphatase MutT (NUDIX family)